MQGHNSFAHFDVVVGNKVANMVIVNPGSAALYFDLVYSQNSSSSQRGRRLGKMAAHFSGSQEKT